MARNITLKIWDNKDKLINNKRIQVIDEYVEDDKIYIPFDEDLFQALQEEYTSYELVLDNVPLVITKVYKNERLLVIKYIV